MSTPLREVAAFFGISVDSKELEKADDKIGDFIEKLKKVAAAGIWGEIAKQSVEFFKGQVENATKLQNVSEKLDISVAQLKAFGFAAAAAGIDSDSAAAMLGRFERATSGAGKGGAAAAGELAKLGIKTKGVGAKNTVDTMLDLADAFQKMPDRAHKTAAAIQLFGREGLAMIPVLEQGRDKMKELFKESEELGSGLGPEFYKNVKEVNEQFEHMEYGLNSLKERALEAILPYLMTLGKWFVEGVKKVIEFTKQTNVLKTGIIALTAVIAVGLVRAIVSLAQKFGLLEAEALPWVALAAVLYLAFDELYTMIEGGDTIIGRFLDSLGGIGTQSTVVLELVEIFKEMGIVIETVADVIKDTLLAAVETVVDEVKGLAGALQAVAHGDFKGAWEAIKGGNKEAADDLQKRGGNIAKTASRFVDRTAQNDSTNNLLAAGIDPRMLHAGLLGKATAGSAAATRAGITGVNGLGAKAFADSQKALFQHGGWKVPIPGHPGQASAPGHVVHQTNHNNVTVTGATDPEKTGKAAAGGIEKGVKRANLNAQKRANVP